MNPAMRTSGIDENGVLYWMTSEKTMTLPWFDHQHGCEGDIATLEGDEPLRFALVEDREILLIEVVHRPAVSSHCHVQLLKIDRVLGRDRDRSGVDFIPGLRALDVGGHNFDSPRAILVAEIDAQTPGRAAQCADGTAVDKKRHLSNRLHRDDVRLEDDLADDLVSVGGIYEVSPDPGRFFCRRRQNRCGDGKTADQETDGFEIHGSASRSAASPSSTASRRVD
jgi:hypothetical protein